DKRTGKDRWKTDRTSRGSWTSPVVAWRGKPEVVVSSGGSVAGYDPATGKQLWELTGLAGNTLPSACVAGDLILVSGSQGSGRAKSDPAALAKSNCCLRLKEMDGRPGYEVCWSAEKATASYATPLVHAGYAYFVNSVGVVFCLDQQTGKTMY